MVGYYQILHFSNIIQPCHPRPCRSVIYDLKKIIGIGFVDSFVAPSAVVPSVEGFARPPGSVGCLRLRRGRRGRLCWVAVAGNPCSRSAGSACSYPAAEARRIPGSFLADSCLKKGQEAMKIPCMKQVDTLHTYHSRPVHLSLESSHELSLIPSSSAGATPLLSRTKLASSTGLLLLLLVSSTRVHLPSWSRA